MGLPSNVALKVPIFLIKHEISRASSYALTQQIYRLSTDCAHHLARKLLVGEKDATRAKDVEIEFRAKPYNVTLREDLTNEL